MTPEHTTPEPNAAEAPDPFYVGYLPAPEAHRAGVKRCVILIGVWLAFCAFALVLTMRSPGTGVWDNANERSWTGLLLTSPYPMLITDEGTLLVVGMGKHGVHERLEPHSGHRVTLRGYELQREGRRMIELAQDAPAQLTNAATETPALHVMDLEPIDLTGEIIDGKCFLGAMKPGDGFAHRSCAVLCIRGGLPPMFNDDNDENNDRLPLLIIDDSTQLPEPVLAHVATRVHLKARRASIGTLPVLLVDSGTIERSDRLFTSPDAVLIEQGTD